MVEAKPSTTVKESEDLTQEDRETKHLIVLGEF